MNVLARFDPGDAVTRVVLITLVQTSVVILSAALLACTAFRRRADARHSLWLAVLVWVAISPGVAALADRSGFGFWVVDLPSPTTADAAFPASPPYEEEQYCSAQNLRPWNWHEICASSPRPLGDCRDGREVQHGIAAARLGPQ